MSERVVLRTTQWTVVQTLLWIVVLARLARGGRGPGSLAVTVLIALAAVADLYQVTVVTKTHLEVRRVFRGWRAVEWSDVLVLERRWVRVHAVLRDGTALPLYGVRWREYERPGEPDVTTAGGLAAWARRCVGVPHLTPG